MIKLTSKSTVDEVHACLYMRVVSAIDDEGAQYSDAFHGRITEVHQYSDGMVEVAINNRARFGLGGEEFLILDDSDREILERRAALVLELALIDSSLGLDP